MMLQSRMGVFLVTGVMVALLTACGAKAPESAVASPASADGAANPFLTPSPLPYGLPPFDQIEHAHFAPAFAAGMAEERAQVEAILANSGAPSFENTIVALEMTGSTLDRVSRVFYALSSAHTNDDIQALRADLAPQLAAHRDAIMLNPALFERVAMVYGQREALGLEGEALRLVEEIYKDFQRAGAALDDGARARLKEINSALAKESAAFSDAVLSEVNASAIVVENEAELAGLSEDRRAALAQAADEAGLGAHRWLISLRNTTGQPVVADLTHRPLRERLQKASEARGRRGGDFDNRARVLAILKLRAEKASLLGFENYAAYAVANQTAQTPEAVASMLSTLAPRAVANARREGAALQALIDREGGGHALEAWDW
ncbi:MAG: M3 family metallopeptidase, partial [Pseudomonadales bacterium]